MSEPRPVHPVPGALQRRAGRYQSALERLILAAHTHPVSVSKGVSEALSIGLEVLELDTAAFYRIRDGAFATAYRIQRDTADGLSETAGAALADLAFRSAGPLWRDAGADTDVSGGADPADTGAACFIAERVDTLAAPFGSVVFAARTPRPYPFDEDDRKIVGLIAKQIASVIERSEQHQPLRRNRDELAMILDSVPSAIVFKGADGTIHHANIAARAFTQPAESMALDQKTLLAGIPVLERVESWSGPNGCPRWMRIDRIPFDDGAPNAARILLVATEVTALVEKENELQKANDDLNQFAYIASHDLQEPLRKIGTFTDVLMEGLAANDKAEVNYAVNVIKDSSRRAAALIRDLLAWSRLTNRGSERTHLSFGDFVRETLADLLAARPDETVTIVDGMDDSTALADVTQLRQLIENLSTNALKYRHPDRALRLELRLFSSETNGHTVFEMADNGIGFEAAQAKIIFEPFRRLHNDRSYRGTGVGLAICARVCERHGWTISASGKPNEGAVFRVEMPRRSAL